MRQWLTSRIHDTALENADETPFYSKPTIARKMKDSELVRIADEKTRTDRSKMIISEHQEGLRTDRLNPRKSTKLTGQSDSRAPSRASPL